MPATAPVEDRLNFYAMSTLAKAALQCGFNLPEALARARVGVALSDHPQALNTLEGAARLFEACEQASTTGYFPLALGDNFAFDAIPEVDTFIATCPTLRVVMTALSWTPQVVHPALRLTLQEAPPVFRIELSVKDGEAPPPGVVEATLATVVKFCRLVLPQRDVLQAVHFTHAPRAPLEVYERFFRAPVLFGQQVPAVVNRSEALDWPLQGAYPALNAQAQLLIEQRLRQLHRGESTTARLEQLLGARMELLGAGIEEVAAALDMHARTLQRRLREEGCSFAEAQARVRREKACRLLRDTDLDIGSISIKLGFKDRHSFTRAFTRWEGVPPMAYRKPEG